MSIFSPSEAHKNPNNIVKNDIPWSDEDTHVVHLTADDFQQYIQSHDSVLIMFYAPCKIIFLSRCKYLKLLWKLVNLLRPCSRPIKCSNPNNLEVLRHVGVIVHYLPHKRDHFNHLENIEEFENKLHVSH